MKTIAVFLLFVATGSLALAAPIPGSGKKAMPKLGVYKSPKGFQINLAGSEWLPSAPPKKTKRIAAMFRSPHLKNNMRGTMTVRVDELKKRLPLKKYVKRWTKQYPKFGFDVLGAKKFSLRGQKGYVIDLVNRKKERKLRQVIFMKGRRAVLMTCRDHMKSFKTTLKQCNQLVKGFQWKKALAKKQRKKTSKAL